MLPETIFPEFVPDQVLTSDDLNNLFGYLDEQGRLTRSNLIGIGIVCGLQVKTNPSKTAITITKGVGVTSQGYLVKIDADTVYSAFKAYNTLQENTYEKFVNEGVLPKTTKFDLLELKENIADGTALTSIPLGLDQYLILLFVELLEEQNKNCDPNSCDDKGINVIATIKPLLVLKTAPNLNTLIGITGNPSSYSPFYSLPEIKMPRYDVVNTSPVQSHDLLQVYVNLLSDVFITNVETTLTAAHTTFSAFLGASGSSPFAGLKTSFDFIRNILTKNQLLHLQYYYDIFSDLLLAYDEFRKSGNAILSICCPDESLFPRHLLLGEAVPTASPISSFRHYFIYSPLFEKKNLMLELKSLFLRMQLMKDNIFIPPFGTGAVDNDVQITPSKLGDFSLSQKAIPYYYKPLPVYQSWSFDKTLRNKANQNLSYHASAYNNITPIDDSVVTPLKYDLEPNNFLRIEGHIGQKYKHVIASINTFRTSYRLPVDVIALSTGEADLSKIADAIVSCNIRDLETSYEIIRREWEAIIGKMIEYLHDNQADARFFLREASVGSDVVADYLVLLNKAKTFMVTDLKVFISKYNDFLIPVYEEVEKQSQDLRTAIVDVINNQALDKVKMTLAEDMVDHFDEVVLSCKKGGFRSIFQQFNSRLNEIYSYMFFSRFIEKHPGIQHKAGVPLGGTFIVVYHKKPDPKNIKGPFTIRGVSRTVTGAPFFGVVQVNNAETNVSAFLHNDGSFELTVNALPAILKITKFGAGTFETGELLVTSPAQSPITILVPSPNVVIENSTNNVYDLLNDEDVIADFYLPYICSSNCTPIQFVIQEAVNLAPSADAGPDQTFTLPKNSTLLDGSKSVDPEGKPLKFSWALVSAQQGVVFSDNTSKQPGVSNLNEPGQYIFELTVTDEGGVKSNTDQVTITVTPEPNEPPAANAGEDQLILQPATTVVLTGTGTDPENQTLNFAWTLVSGPVTTINFSNPNEASTTVSNLTAVGSYTLRLTVADIKNATATDDVIITVRANDVPIAEAGANFTHVMLSDTDNVINLNGSGSDPDGGPVTFLWTGPAQFTIISPTSASTAVSGLVPGAFTFVLTVTDDEGTSSTDNVTVRMIVKPIANAGDDTTITLPQNITLNSSGSSDPDGTLGVNSFNWKKLSGPAGEIFDASQPNPVVTGLQAGTYVFELTVTDADGLAAQDQVSIVVSPEAIQKSCAPLADIITDFNKLKEVNTEEVFKSFTNTYDDYKEIEAFYIEMADKGIALLSVDKQIDFFVAQKISNRLVKWIQNLQTVIQNFDLRLLALSMLNVLAELAYYIACIQKEDIDKAKVPMIEALDVLARVLESIKPLLPNFIQAQTDVLKQLLSITNAESARVTNNGEEASKPLYVQRLKSIIDILNSMAL